MRRRLQRPDGSWLAAPDPGNEDRAAGWFDHEPPAFARATPVPASIQQVFPGYHGVACCRTWWNTPPHR